MNRYMLVCLAFLFDTVTAHAAVPTSQVLNDSNVPGTTAQQALNNLYDSSTNLNYASITTLRANAVSISNTAVSVGTLRGGLFYGNTADTTTGWTGTYSISGTALTIGSTTSGAMAAGLELGNNGVAESTWVVSGSGNNWVVSTSQNISMGAGTADNGLTIYVDKAGDRIYRNYTGEVSAFWAGVTGNPNGDDTTNLKYTLLFCSSPNPNCTVYMPAANPVYGTSTCYTVSGPLTYIGDGGIDMAASLGYDTGNGSICATGSGYTVLTFTGGSPQTVRVSVIGTGNAVNGEYFNGAAVFQVQQLHNYNMTGACFNVTEGFDFLIYDISDLKCGGTTAVAGLPAYGGSINDGGGTSNECHILRWQEELDTAQAIFVSPNTVNCVIDSIHSERATGVTGYVTWLLGGNRVHYDSTELDALNPSVANATINAATGTFTNYQEDTGVITTLQGYGGGAGIVFINPYVIGTFQEFTNQTGTIVVEGGIINSIVGQTNGYRITGTTINSLSMDFSNSVPTSYFYEDIINNITSTNTTSAGTFIDDSINAVTSLPYVFVARGTTITASGGLIPPFGAALYLDHDTINANVTVANGNVTFVGDDTTINGFFDVTAGNQGIIFNGSSSISGAITGLSTPNNGTWNPGQTTKNMAPTSTHTPCWVNTATSPGVGTWTACPNL